MKSCLPIVVVTLILALPAMATDLKQELADNDQPIFCAQQNQAHMTPVPVVSVPQGYCWYSWYEYRWVEDGCCDRLGSLRVNLKEQRRKCCEIVFDTVCYSWTDTGEEDCTNYPCEPF